MKISQGNVNKEAHVLVVTEEQAKKSGLPEKDFSGKDGEMLFAYKDGKKFLAFGIGKEKDLTEEKIRRSGASVIDKMKESKISVFSLEMLLKDKKDFYQALVEGLLLGNYRFNKYKKKEQEKEVKEVVIVAQGVENSIRKAQIVCNNIITARDIVNDSPSLMNTLEMEKIARRIAKEAKLKITVFDEKTLKKLGMNLMLAVGSASNSPPRLVILEYNGNPKSKEKIAFVGKGITFDSGGINLKPTGFIENMKLDKSGALSVIFALKALAELKAKVNVVAVAPFCENMIGPLAYKPGDLIVSYSGKTVEVGNTDAEGRMILADTMAYIVKNIKPKAIVDLATLTSSCLQTFGEHVAGMFSNNENLSKKVFASGERTYERVWELPLYEEYEKDAETPIADVKNIGGKVAGAINGALFIKQFVGKTPWVHLDIAGPAWAEKRRTYYTPGATGWGVRLLVDLAEKL